MSIRRGILAIDQDFTIIRNAWARDGRMSMRARGLLVQLLSHRPGWEVTIESLVRDNPEGRDAVRSAIHELEELGYLVREQRREGTKFSGVDYTMQDPWNPSVGKPDVGFSDVGETTHKEDYSPEDHLPEDDQRPSAPTGDAPAEVVRTKKDHPAHVIATRAYDATHGALKFMAVRAVAKWAIDKRGETPARTEEGIAALHHMGKPITRATLDQWFDGSIRRGPWNTSPEQRAADILRMGQQMQDHYEQQEIAQ